MQAVSIGILMQHAYRPQRVTSESHNDDRSLLGCTTNRSQRTQDTRTVCNGRSRLARSECSRRRTLLDLYGATE